MLGRRTFVHHHRETEFESRVPDTTKSETNIFVCEVCQIKLGSLKTDDQALQIHIFEIERGQFNIVQ